MQVRHGRSHVAAVRRLARRKETENLISGSRSAPASAFDLCQYRRSVASSASAEGLLKAHPAFSDLSTIRERLKEPVLEWPISQHMERNFKDDHLAGMCQLCVDPHLPDEERIAGFCQECWALRLYADGTRGVRAHFTGTPPAPSELCSVVSYPSIREHPASVEKCIVQFARAGAFGALNGRMFGKPIRQRTGRKFGQRSYRQLIPTAIVSTVRPPCCAPFGAAVRYSDRIAAALKGESPKVRVIFDLTTTGMNGACSRWRFRYAGLEALLPHLTQGCYCASYDLSKMYCQIPVDEFTSQYFHAQLPPLSDEARAELGVSGNAPHYVRYRTLPMGWTSACGHASVVTAAICEEAVRRGAICAVSYIDDIVCTGKDRDECARSQAIIKLVIEERFGLELSASKTQEPQQLLTWIGIEIDSKQQQFTISAERREKIAVEIDSILEADRPSVARLRSCLGRLSWLSMVMRGARAYSSPLFGAIKGKHHNDRVTLEPRERADLQWFIDHLRSAQWSGTAWLRPQDDLTVTKSDAGEDAVFLVCDGRFIYHRLTESEKSMSSHARELLPSVLAAQIFGPEWYGRVVAMMFDNSGTAYTVSSGRSRSDADASAMMRTQADLSLRYDFDLIGVWGPRSANVLCDAGSKWLAGELTTAPVRLSYAPSEIAASTLPVGSGCWLYPRGWCAEAAAVIGYVRGDEHRC